MKREAVEPFVDVEWCKQNRRRVVLADVRWYLDGSPGREAYDGGHIPGAVFVDLDRWLSAEGSPLEGRNPLPAPHDFALGMREVGISDDDIVVAYDDAGGVIAARLVWMLRATGHNSAILDGGMASYKGPLETEHPSRPTGHFTAKPWPSARLAEIHELSTEANLVVDARNRDRFEGKQDPIDPRPGHVPGARNVPCRENLDASGKLHSKAELLRIFAAAGIASAENVISYCGSGVTACHNLLALEFAGLGRGRLFTGGWSQYGHALELPVELGPA
ncbi:sulfurtransferase [Arthrobacter sp. AZCC_0090]|uniref:sulfurtransferase n=1 Tax=Arthrobacter sp. AZCC_0090 TaxID=2735881 RepID=UPI001615FA15|nr:sulfurtransferase [Arthrobacter sp. AZCC_0090]MBB6406679.1 thiosulfate/3-mercaptopyruvate sulfurtransferase [Arthrobacter sp. AZCC_0090]